MGAASATVTVNASFRCLRRVAGADVAVATTDAVATDGAPADEAAAAAKRADADAIRRGPVVAAAPGLVTAPTPHLPALPDGWQL